MPINTNRNPAPAQLCWLLAVVLISAGGWPGPSSAADTGEPCAERLAATIQLHYESVDDFSANFEQRTQSVMFGGTSLGADAPSTGFVQFAKPGKMRWRYETPTESLVISDGKILWIYDVAAKEAQRLPVTEGYLTGAALEFLLGEGKILEQFDVAASTCVPDAMDALELTLTPKRPASYETLGLRANPTTGQILATSLVDLFGNKTLISFSNTRINLAPKASTFEFEIPSDVRVIDLVPAP